MKKVLNPKKMKNKLQYFLVFLAFFGINQKVHASQRQHKIRYKVEQCDCVGYKEGLLTFLSDIAGTPIFNITGEGATRSEAENQAQGLCLELYKNFEASVDNSSVSQAGCYTYRKKTNGQWEAI